MAIKAIDLVGMDSVSCKPVIKSKDMLYWYRYHYMHIYYSGFFAPESMVYKQTRWSIRDLCPGGLKCMIYYICTGYYVQAAVFVWHAVQVKILEGKISDCKKLVDNTIDDTYIFPFTVTTVIFMGLTFHESPMWRVFMILFSQIYICINFINQIPLIVYCCDGI